MTTKSNKGETQNYENTDKDSRAEEKKLHSFKLLMRTHL